ncbi:MAG: hypothetical protein OQK78_09665 [Gammaproteobacteria bacterium]|nr:hypothetical protein [Gammaproteobacteria bacterium]
MFEINKSKEYLLILTTLSALLSPAAYIIGFYYELGFANSFGLQRGTFPPSVTEVFESTFIYLWGHVGVPIIGLFRFLLDNPKLILVGILALFIFAWIIVKVLNNERSILLSINKLSKSLQHKLKINNTDVIRAAHGTSVMSWHISKWLYIFMLITILWVGIPLHSLSAGQTLGRDKINSYIKSGCQKQSTGWSNCISVIQNPSGKVLEHGLFLAGDTERIALYSKDRLRIISLTPDLTIERDYLANR